MGILRAVTGSIESVLREQWREVFSCDALPEDVLLIRAKKRVSARSANNDPNDQIVTNGSLLFVAEGQCLIVTSQGKVVTCCQKSGPYVFVDPTHPGGVKGFARDVWQRVGFGGAPVQPITHRVYYLNMKESFGNRFCTPSPIPYAARDDRIGLDITVGLRLRGTYSYRVADPEKLYRSIIAGGNGDFTRRRLNGQLESELLFALQVALSKAAQSEMRLYRLSEQMPVLSESVRERLKEPLFARWGIEIISLTFDPPEIPDAAEAKMLQYSAVLKDPTPSEGERGTSPFSRSDSSV